MSHEILITIARVAAALAGFSGVVFALGNRAGRTLSAKEESGLTHMLLTSFYGTRSPAPSSAMTLSQLGVESAIRQALRTSSTVRRCAVRSASNMALQPTFDLLPIFAVAKAAVASNAADIRR